MVVEDLLDCGGIAWFVVGDEQEKKPKVQGEGSEKPKNSRQKSQ